MMALLLIGMLASDNAGAHAAEIKADRVVVVKSERTLTLFAHGKEIKRYKVALGGSPVGPKVKQGDHKTPEGHYLLDWRNPKSKFYKSIHISYPDLKDRLNAEKNGSSPGGDIMIHGLQNGFAWLGAAHRAVDWTDGCIAVTNSDMDEIWNLVPDGTPIEIRP